MTGGVFIRNRSILFPPRWNNTILLIIEFYQHFVRTLFLEAKTLLGSFLFPESVTRGVAICFTFHLCIGFGVECFICTAVNTRY